MEDRLVWRELLVDLALVAVRGRDLDRTDAAQFVELRKEDIAQRVQPRRVLQQHAIEPPHPALSPRYGAELRTELSTHAAQAIGDLAFDLRREGTGADARAMRL